MAAQPAVAGPAAVPGTVALAVAGPLAVPAPPTATFANFFLDVTDDPLNGQYRELFAHFEIEEPVSAHCRRQAKNQHWST